MHFGVNIYIILNNKNKKCLIIKKSCALEERHNSLYSSIQTRFWGKRRTHKKKIIFMNAIVSACLWGAIELHFLWNKVFFYLADLKEIKTNLHQIKPMTCCLAFTHEKWSSLRLKHHTSWFSAHFFLLATNVQVIQNIYIYILYLLYNSVPNINKRIQVLMST